MENNYMIIETRRLFAKTARVILDDKALIEAFDDSQYIYVSGLSYTDLSVRGARKKTKETTIIHLNEDYFKKFNDTTRNEIRRTEKIPELSFRVPDPNIDEIYLLYKKFEKGGGRSVRRKSYFKESLLAGAYWGDELIAAVLCYDAPPHLRANAIVSRRDENKLFSKWKSFASRRLIYEICKYGESRGYQHFDLGGINRKEKSKKGITTFKLGFGGEIVNDYTYTKRRGIFSYVYSIFH